MTNFNTAFAKNFTKLSFITIGALSSTLGLHTELTLITESVSLATWLTIGWIVIVLAAIAHYKANQDVELEVFRDFERTHTGHTLWRFPHVTCEQLLQLFSHNPHDDPIHFLMT